MWAWPALAWFEDSHTLYHNLTGVLREYRGRHIAQALKLLAVQAARRYGAVRLRTNNDSQNAPMLAINRKMGYVPQPGKYLITHHHPQA